MTSSFVRLVSLITLGLSAAACAVKPQVAPTPTATAMAWSSVLLEAAADVQAGRHADADRLLLEFQRTHPAAPEATEAAYYRALYRMDPTNPAVSTRDAVMLLDAILATPIVTAPIPPRHQDAAILRRVASNMDTRPVTVVTTPAASASPAAPRAEDSRAKDEEIARLKEELSKANAELERIKRRVATPTP